MSKLTDRLKRLGIFNDFGFCYEKGAINTAYPLVRPTPPQIEGIPEPVPFISYTPAQGGRGYKSACWQVTRLGYQTDKDAHWRDNGQKTFDVSYRDQKAPQLEAALAWATKRYGVANWVKTPFGAYAPEAFVKARLAQLLEFEKANPE